ncbi:hypothetical protein H8R23_04590 [Flavobacterium sp. F-380]|uniref:Uncharacterized protein n=1 Tax=Flavobacterium kayseriense TaxID=2764714 RepID=A0ABR7J557_9FLAO|nr:hypothetical protein [Flavobacterium kayseriense]MBC5840675.1 hypothetical protein [Flavobacterium kayseriense]MBC5846655.1 hypothetical protein [Flavobacterium kayseriense]
MDFNDIQSAWDNDSNENVVLPSNLEKIQTANTPLDKIKKNLKNELVFQSLTVLLSGFAPVIHGFPVKWITPFYFVYSMFAAVSIYYLIRLFLFYKRLSKTTLNTKDSLYETYFDVRLNMELYKTFTFALTPFMVMFLLGFALYAKPALKIAELSNSVLITTLIIISSAILFVGLMTEWWVQHYYGKYANEIKKVIEELKEE